MKRYILRIIPIFYILIVWLLFSYPFFFMNLVPFPAKYQVTFFHPWSMYEKWWGPVKNNAMPDIITQIYPWKHFTIEKIKQGQLPFWNPYSFSGNPHVGNFQSAVFSPFSILFLVLPFIDAWSLIVLLQQLLAGLFMYLFLRSIYVNNTLIQSNTKQRSFADAQDDRTNLSKIAALIGSITFMYCGFNVVWMAYGTLSMAIIFLPLALYGIERAFNTNKIRYLLLMTLSICVSFFSGHIQTSVYFVFFLFGYILFKTILHFFSYYKSKLKGVRSELISARKVVIFSFIFFVLGILISLIQIYPTFILYQQSVRSSSLHLGGGIPWNYLVTMIAPDFYGNPVTRNDWFGTYAEWSGFIGIIPLLLALFAIFQKRNVYTLFFTLAGITSLAFAVDSPLHAVLLASKIPVLATSIPSRIIVLFSFSAAVLAAFGYDVLTQKLAGKSAKKLLPVFIAVGSLLLLTWFSLLVMKVLPNDKQQLTIAIKNLILPTVFFGITIIIVCIPVFFSRFRVTRFAIYGLLLLSSIDSLRFAAKWIPFDSRTLVFPEVPVIQAMQKVIGYGRYFGNLGTEVSTYYGLPSIEGYDPLYIQRYGEFIRYAETGSRQDAERSVVRLNRRGKYAERVLDLLGVNIIFHPLADTNTTWAFPVWQDIDKYSVIYQDDKFQLYRNNEAIPRAKLFYSYEVIADKEKILNRLYEESFQFRNVLVLERKPTKVIASDFESLKQTGTAKIVLYSPNKIVIETKSVRPALLFLSDNYYPNWHAYINGKETEIYRADYTFRAVVIPAGKSTVEFTYKEFPL